MRNSSQLLQPNILSWHNFRQMRVELLQRNALVQSRFLLQIWAKRAWRLWKWNMKMKMTTICINKYVIKFVVRMESVEVGWGEVKGKGGKGEEGDDEHLLNGINKTWSRESVERRVSSPFCYYYLSSFLSHSSPNGATHATTERETKGKHWLCTIRDGESVEGKSIHARPCHP